MARTSLHYLIGGLLLVTGSVLIWQVWHSVSCGVNSAYAEWGIACVLIDYMERNGGDWPSGWDDLQPAIDAGEGRVGGWGLDDYRRYIRVDWNVNPKKMISDSMSSNSPTSDLVNFRGVRLFGFEGKGGNDILHQYFRKQAAKQQEKSSKSLFQNRFSAISMTAV